MVQPLELQAPPDDPDAAPAAAARLAITERLCEVVAWPSTRISQHERQLAGDLLVGLLKFCPEATRRSCAQRLVGIVDAPKPVLRYLARDEISIAEPLLRESKSFDDLDLIETIRVATPGHVELIAQRKQVSETVTDAIVRRGVLSAIEAMAANANARIAASTMDVLVRVSREHPTLAALLARREELRMAQGLTLFWWSSREARTAILRRFAIDRVTLLAEMKELFALAATPAIADPEVRKALQFIERRQRARHSSSVTGATTVEALLDAIAAQGGLSRALVIDLARMCGVRPATCARILVDRGGEPLAVLAKAIGLKRESFAKLWRLARSRDVAGFEPVSILYETLSATKAQTVLRYWDWGLTAGAESGAGETDEDMDLAPARRFFSLVRAQEL
ncbi:MAG: DUF2336 domain-containing protein [Alphaproteobacteria bacterium]|nr:DUF2336 domain-containing protein [Alphaproteobacteria bacterium]